MIREALAGTLINQATNGQITKTLSIIYSLIGLRPQHFPTMAEDQFLFTYLRAEFGLKTLEEIVLAFRLAIKDELDIEDYKVYDQFTPEYLSRIMTAYRKWLKQKNKEVDSAPVKMIQNNVITTQEEKLQDIAEWEAKQDLKLDLIPPYIYDYLVEFEKIKPGRVEKWKAMAKATGVRKGQLYEESLSMNKKAIDDYNFFLKMFETGEYVGDEINRLKLLAKKIMVFDYLTNLKP